MPVLTVETTDITDMTAAGRAMSTAEDAAAARDTLELGDLATEDNWITETSGSSTLASAYTISAANNTYVATGLSVSLPAAGTYRVTFEFRARVAFSAGTAAYIVGKLRNTSDGADVSNSERLAVYSGVFNNVFQQTCPINEIVTVTGAKTIELYVFRGGATSWTTSDIPSDTAGRSKASYVRIG